MAFVVHIQDTVTGEVRQHEDPNEWGMASEYSYLEGLRSEDDELAHLFRFDGVLGRSFKIVRVTAPDGAVLYSPGD